jgi:hypothetical protein
VISHLRLQGFRLDSWVLHGSAVDLEATAGYLAAVSDMTAGYPTGMPDTPVRYLTVMPHATAIFPSTTAENPATSATYHTVSSHDREISHCHV